MKKKKSKKGQKLPKLTVDGEEQYRNGIIIPYSDGRRFTRYGNK